MKHPRSCLCWTLLACSLSAVAPAAAGEPGQDLTIEALTFGPGDHPFFKFGHNAILVRPQAGQGLVYNFGTFNFDSPALILKFLGGRFKYWLSVSLEDDTLEAYAGANRSILAQELDLSADQKWALARALRENAQPENRAYLYDYFYDNCSTRVRDAIDRVVEGRVRAAGQAQVGMTFREHALRMTADVWLEYVGLYLGLGRSADIPINRWHESFLPDRLSELLRLVRVPDGAKEKNLVKFERVIHEAKRPPVPAVPPKRTPYFLALGFGLGAVLLLAGHLGRRHAGARIALGCIAFLLGTVAGLIGLIMTCLWAFTDHRVAYANANILQFPPWLIAFMVYGIRVALGRARSIARARILALCAVVICVAGIACKALPGLNQDNLPFIWLCVPIWVGLWLGLRRLASAGV